MSRSRRKTPIIAYTTTESEALWKAKCARKVRRAVRASLGVSTDSERLPLARYALDHRWDGPKDGKHWVAGLEAKWMRK
jgi:hypothetical protein